MRLYPRLAEALGAVPSLFRSPRVRLGFFWCMGLCTGSFAAVHTTCPLSSLMGAAASGGVSIIGLFVSLCVPFMISVLCLRFHALILIYLTAFCKAVILGFCSCAVYCCFGSAGWLVRGLLLFSEIISCTALLWLVLKHISGSDHLLRDSVLCGTVIAAAGLADYLAVSPFLAELWNFT